MGGKIDYKTIVHTPDDGNIADKPVEMAHTTQEKRIAARYIDVDEAQFIEFVDGNQVDRTY